MKLFVGDQPLWGPSCSLLTRQIVSEQRPKFDKISDNENRDHVPSFGMINVKPQRVWHTQSQAKSGFAYLQQLVRNWKAVGENFAKHWMDEFHSCLLPQMIHRWEAGEAAISLNHLTLTWMKRCTGVSAGTNQRLQRNLVFSKSALATQKHCECFVLKVCLRERQSCSNTSLEP